MTTPIMTTHARERCAEMGISTKVAKRIVRHADLRRPGRRTDREVVIATFSRYPGYAVVYEALPGGASRVVTVLFKTAEHYQRNGATFTPVGTGL